MAPENGFSRANFMEIITHVAEPSYSGCWDSPRASFCYSTGILAILYCIILVSGIHTLLGTIFFNKINRLTIQ